MVGIAYLWLPRVGTEAHPLKLIFPASFPS